jgi:hypothetical protein
VQRIDDSQHVFVPEVLSVCNNIPSVADRPPFDPTHAPGIESP